MSDVAAQPGLSPEAYLVRERAATERSEYVNGQVYALSGVSRAHRFIAGNIFAALHARLRGRPCEIHASDMRVKVRPTGMYTHPDIVVACGEPRFEDAHVDTLLDPTLVVEVLSDSTEAYDRGHKFAHYRRLPSLREYVLVSQHQPLVERFELRGEVWALTDAIGLDATIALPSIDCTLALRDVYERVELATEPGRAPLPV